MFKCGFVRSNFALAMAVPTPRVLSLPAANARGDLLGDRLRNLLVRVELHRVGRATLGPRAKVGSVPEHLRERHLRTHDLSVAALLHAFDLSPPRRQVADDVSHV